MTTSTPASKKFARALLATTSLTALATGAAYASAITETTDFGNTFGAATALPTGTDQVFGTVNSGSDSSDWFQFSSLLGGDSFSLQAQFNPLGTEGGLRIDLFDSTGTKLTYGSVSNGAGSPSLEGSGTIITGTLPLDGNLFANVFTPSSANRDLGYAVDLTATTSTTPEPSTAAVAALGLALSGALAWRRKRVC
jgi:hypothetical protein